MRFASFLAAALALAPVVAVGADAAAEVERGRYLTAAAGCAICHTEDREGAARFAGGRPLESEFGTFYAPNITPDPDTGIGRWTEAQFRAALRDGQRPAGSSYFPAFPFTSYTGITDGDAAAIFAYLMTVPAVKQASRSHQMPWYMKPRSGAGFWKGLYFKAGAFVPDTSQSPEWNRGAYLVRHLGHCGECHTPRGRLGSLQHERELAGNPAGPEGRKVANITPHDPDGIGAWSQSELETFLELGMLPDGDFVGAGMGEVIDENTSQLTAADRTAIAVYLRSLPPLPDAPAREP
jgi:mono/diheme cytochrome c family protein